MRRTAGLLCKRRRLKDEKTQLHEKNNEALEKSGASPSCRYKREMRALQAKRQKRPSRRSGHAAGASSGGAVSTEKLS